MLKLCFRENLLTMMPSMAVVVVEFNRSDDSVVCNVTIFDYQYFIRWYAQSVTQCCITERKGALTNLGRGDGTSPVLAMVSIQSNTPIHTHTHPLTYTQLHTHFSPSHIDSSLFGDCITCLIKVWHYPNMHTNSIRYEANSRCSPSYRTAHQPAP